MFFEQIINGLTIGSIYALVAIGYTLVLAFWSWSTLQTALYICWAAISP